MKNGPRQRLMPVRGRARVGDDFACNDLIVMIYKALRAVKVRMTRKERPGNTLPPTAVVHEALMRMMGDEVDGRME